MKKSTFRTLAQVVMELETLGVIGREDVVKYHFSDEGGSSHHISIQRVRSAPTYELKLLEDVFKREFPHIEITKSVENHHGFTFEAQIFGVLV